jgi:hypothetical protein
MESKPGPDMELEPDPDPEARGQATLVQPARAEEGPGEETSNAGMGNDTAALASHGGQGSGEEPERRG